MVIQYQLHQTIKHLTVIFNQDKENDDNSDKVVLACSLRLYIFTK